MFAFAKSLGDEQYPFVETQPTTGSETYSIGEALVLSSGKLTKASSTTKPTFICVENYVAPATGNRAIAVMPILPHYLYKVPFCVSPEGLAIWSKVQLGTDGLTITAATGTPQKTTATAAGTVTTAGNAAVVVTSALLEKDETLDVAVELGDEAADIAEKIRAALAENETITQHFTVSGTGASVVLATRLYAADDETLNISIADGTGDGASEGVTTAAESVSTSGTANNGVATVTNIEGLTALVRFI